VRPFTCDACDHPLHFETIRCDSCNRRQGFDPGVMDLIAFDEDGMPVRGGASAVFCANAEGAGCNWMAVPGEVFCAACRYNRTIPDLSVPDNRERWTRIEAAKRRMVYGLFRLGLKPPTRQEAPDGLAFDFLSDAPHLEQRVMTGHDEGLITLNIVEADDVERERLRLQMGEPYRTLVGHFRHEVGHYVWILMAQSPDTLARYREVFGDEREDYGEALKRHYANGPPERWQDHFVSAYASSHSWEDFAETWAHYLHIVDTLETAHALTMSFRTGKSRTFRIDFDPYVEPRFPVMVEAWMHMAFGLNELARSMGTSDLYPFALSPEVIGKLAFIHTWLAARSGRLPAAAVETQPLEAMAAGLRSGFAVPAPEPQPEANVAPT
jgi:hypothetical protein